MKQFVVFKVLRMIISYQKTTCRIRARGATLKVGGLTSDSKWGGGGGGGGLKTLLPSNSL